MLKIIAILEYSEKPTEAPKSPKPPREAYAPLGVYDVNLIT